MPFEELRLGKWVSKCWKADNIWMKMRSLGSSRKSECEGESNSADQDFIVLSRAFLNSNFPHSFNSIIDKVDSSGWTWWVFPWQQHNGGSSTERESSCDETESWRNTGVRSALYENQYTENEQSPLRTTLIPSEGLKGLVTMHWPWLLKDSSYS